MRDRVTWKHMEQGKMMGEKDEVMDGWMDEQRTEQIEDG